MKHGGMAGAHFSHFPLVAFSHNSQRAFAYCCLLLVECQRHPPPSPIMHGDDDVDAV